MKKRSLYSLIAVALLLIAVLTAPVTDAAVFTFETQSNHSSADMAWLTDVVINEDTVTVGGMVQKAHLTAVPEYKYTETPESFKSDVGYYSSVYSLDLNIAKAGYIYLFDLLNDSSNIVSANVSDLSIRDYLEGLGIVYPEHASSDELVMARALYTALVTGSFTENVTEAKSLDEVIVEYVGVFTGIDSASLKEWMPSGSILSLDDYILAASKLTLWTNGYDVTAETDSDEVYRLIAAMSLKKMGISIEKDAPVKDIMSSYTAALLGVKYGVSLNREKLSEALKLGDEAVAFCILQALGQRADLSIREDNCSYEDAFYLVAENTDVFSLENNEFYADIFEYNVTLSAKRKSIWILPKSYSGTVKNSKVELTADGVSLRDNYFNEIPLDVSLKKQTVTIKSECRYNGKVSECSYVFNIFQGEKDAPKGDIPTVDGILDFSSSNTIIGSIFSAMGTNRVISSVVDSFLVSAPASVKNVLTFIAPSFGDEAETDLPTDGDSTVNAEKEIVCVSILDKIGSVADIDIRGVDGIGYLDGIVSGKQLNLVSFVK